MIRPFTCLCMILAGGSGLYLYQEKHRTSLLDREITRTIHASEAAHERTGLLKAEWALLNEPGRLQDLADRFLALHAMSPAQFVPQGELAQHLPPAGAPAAEPAGTDGGTAVADARPVVPEVAPARPDAVRPPAPRPEPAHVAVAAAEAPHAAAPRPVMATAEAKPAAVVPAAPHPARVASQERHVEPAASYAAGGYTGTGVMTPVMSALAAPRRAEPILTRAAAVMPMRPAYAPAAPVPFQGSSLGTGRVSLPPPVPMGAGAQ